VYPFDASWPVHTCFIKELRTVGSLGYCKHEHGRDFVDAAELLASSPDLVDALITHRFPIDDAVEAYRVACDKSAGARRVIVEPNA